MNSRMTSVVATRATHHGQLLEPSQLQPVRRGSTRAFVASLVLVGVLWGGVLPWVGQFPAVRARIQRQEQSGIDPSAMFYTELGSLSGVRLRSEGKAWCVEEFQLGK